VLGNIQGVTAGDVLTLSNPIFLPPTYSPAVIYFGQERGWWITCNYPTVLKEKNINIKRRTKSGILIFLFPTLFIMQYGL
jgi:hypothetical protein